MYLRKKNNLSLEQAAHGIISSTHLSNIENGRYYPSEEILKLLSKRYNISEDYLLHFDKKDSDLNHQLNELFNHMITNNFLAAQNLIDQIAEKKYINHIEQELIFETLKICLSVKLKKPYEKCLQNLNNLIDDEVLSYPSFLHLCREYLRILVYFHKKDFQGCLDATQMVLKYDLPEEVRSAMELNLLIILYHLKRYIPAIKQAEKALRIFYVNHMWRLLAESYTILIAIYHDNYDYDTALKYSNSAMEIAEKFNFESIKAKLYHNYGIVYKGLEKYDLAIENFKKSIEYKKELNMSPFNSYWSLLDIFVILKDEKSFNQFYEELDDIHEDIEYMKVILNPSLIPDYLTKLKKWANNLELEGKLQSTIRIYKLLSDYYYNERKYKLSSYYYQKVIEITSKTKGEIYI